MKSIARTFLDLFARLFGYGAGCVLLLAAIVFASAAQAGRGCGKDAKTAEPAKPVASSASADDVSMVEHVNPVTPSQIADSRAPSNARFDEVCDKCSKLAMKTKVKQNTVVAAVPAVDPGLAIAQQTRVTAIPKTVDQKVVIKNTRDGIFGRLLGLDRPSDKTKSVETIRVPN